MMRSKTLISSGSFVFTMTLMFAHLAWLWFGPYAQVQQRQPQGEDEVIEIRAEYARAME